MSPRNDLGAQAARLAARIDAASRANDAEIARERDRAEAFLNAVEVMLVALDEDGTIQLVNRFACTVLGWDAGELIGRDWAVRCLPERLRNGWQAQYEQLLAGKLPTGENAVLTQAGTERMIRWRNTVQRDEAGRVTGALCSGTDVTDCHALEAQLHHAQKMEAVGQLAGGIAHDFNNLLTVILGFSHLVLAESAADDPRRPDIEEILHAGLRASALTRQLLSFSRKQAVAPELIDVSVLVEDMRELLSRLIGESIRIDVTHDDAPEWAIADHGQMEQVVMNLAVNARDAMLSGGTLTIGITHVTTTDVHCARGGRLGPGKYVKLTFTDTGTGMTPAVMARLFEPFFTTKCVGKGTGLGLATVHAIVGRFGGCIDVDTFEGRGSTFTVYLPQAIGDTSARPLTAAAPARASRTELILVVDDDRGVRELARRFLERAGYRVIIAANATEARQLLAANPLIALILTDVVMPAESGRDLVRSLRIHRPDLAAVFMSGYAEDAFAQHGGLDADISCLHKPFTAEALEFKVAERLDDWHSR